MRNGTWAALLVILVALCVGAPALAKKGGNGGGGGGGGGGGDPLTGRVYFNENNAQAGGLVRSMAPDGSDVTDEDMVNAFQASMSHERHGGDYWVIGRIVDENGTPNPNGGPPSYLIAQRSDGAGGIEEVQLTTPATGGENIDFPVFGKDDSFVSYVATRWPGGVKQQYLYTAEVSWAATTGAPSLSNETQQVDFTGDAPFANLLGMDWSPNGTHIAYSYSGDIVVADLSQNPPSETNFGAGILPKWSPDGHYLAFFNGANAYGGSLYSLALNGGDAVKLVDESNVRQAASPIGWTEDSENVVFTHKKRRRGKIPQGLDSENYDVARVPVGGGSVTLISDTGSADESFVAWRGD